MKRGFTLVELSIVLVIIGLLIGGVLIGKAILESSKISRLIRDIGQYEVSATQFKSKFRYWPGDAPMFTVPGNGDNILGLGANGNNNCAAAPNASLSNGESTQAWAHLGQSGMMSKIYPPYSPLGTCTGGVHSDSNIPVWAPYTEIDEVFADLDGRSIKQSIFFFKLYLNSNLALQILTKPKDLLAIESKLGSKTMTSNSMLGLTNPNGVGNCVERDDDTRPCSAYDSDLLGISYYFISDVK